MTVQDRPTLALLGRWGEPVRVVTQARTKDRYGNVTVSESERAVARALFEPQQQEPRTDPRSPGVSSPARWYLPPGTPITEDDHVVDPRGRHWVATSVQEWPNGVVVAVKRWGTS